MTTPTSRPPISDLRPLSQEGISDAGLAFLRSVIAEHPTCDVAAFYVAQLIARLDRAVATGMALVPVSLLGEAAGAAQRMAAAHESSGNRIGREYHDALAAALRQAAGGGA